MRRHSKCNTQHYVSQNIRRHSIHLSFLPWVYDIISTCTDTQNIVQSPSSLTHKKKKKKKKKKLNSYSFSTSFHLSWYRVCLVSHYKLPSVGGCMISLDTQNIIQSPSGLTHEKKKTQQLFILYFLSPVMG